MTNHNKTFINFKVLVFFHFQVCSRVKKFPTQNKTILAAISNVCITFKIDRRQYAFFKGLTWDIRRSIPIISLTTRNIHKKKYIQSQQYAHRTPKTPFKIHFLLYVTINRVLQIPENTSCSTPYVILYAAKEKSKEPAIVAIKEDVDKVMVRMALLFYNVMSSPQPQTHSTPPSAQDRIYMASRKTLSRGHCILNETTTSQVSSPLHRRRVCIRVTKCLCCG